MEDLRKELIHHHEKLKQYRDLVNLVSSNDGRDSNRVGDDEAVSKLQDEMNMQQQELDQSYRQLKVKVLQGVKNGEFKDPRVTDLWKRAKAQGLSDEELEIMKVCDF